MIDTAYIMRFATTHRHHPDNPHVKHAALMFQTLGKLMPYWLDETFLHMRMRD